MEEYIIDVDDLIYDIIEDQYRYIWARIQYKTQKKHLAPDYYIKENENSTKNLTDIFNAYGIDSKDIIKSAYAYYLADIIRVRKIEDDRKVDDKSCLMLAKSLLSNDYKYLNIVTSEVNKKKSKHRDDPDVRIENKSNRIFIARAILREFITKKLKQSLISQYYLERPQNMLELLLQNASSHVSLEIGYVFGEFINDLINNPYLDTISFFTHLHNQNNKNKQNEYALIYDLCEHYQIIKDGGSKDIHQKYTYILSKINAYKKHIKKANNVNKRKTKSKN